MQQVQQAQQQQAQQAQQQQFQGQLLGAHTLPHPPQQQHQQSPAAHINVPYGQAKEFLSHRFQSTIISPMQQEIDALRAQVDRLSGVLRPSDPAYQEIVREALARFGKPGSIKLFDRRRVKLTQIKRDLEAKEIQIGALLEEVASLRLNAALYAQRCDIDDELRGEKREEKNDRVGRWEEDAAARDKAARDRVARDQKKLDRRAQPRASASLDRYAAAFAPPQYAAAPAAFAPFPPQSFAGTPASHSRPASAQAEDAGMSSDDSA